MQYCGGYVGGPVIPSPTLADPPPPLGWKPSKFLWLSCVCSLFSSHFLFFDVPPAARPRARHRQKQRHRVSISHRTADFPRHPQGLELLREASVRLGRVRAARRCHDSDDAAVCPVFVVVFPRFLHRRRRTIGANKGGRLRVGQKDTQHIIRRTAHAIHGLKRHEMDMPCGVLCYFVEMLCFDVSCFFPSPCFSLPAQDVRWDATRPLIPRTACR